MLAYEIATDGTVHMGHYLPKVQMKNYKLIIHWRNFFDQPSKII